MKIGILFHKNPLLPSTGIDIVRLRSISKGLMENNMDTEIIAPVEKETVIDGLIPVKPLCFLNKNRYDIIKTCYHFSMECLQDYKGPVVSRIVRVVDDTFPPRDEPMRDRLLKCQELIRTRSAAISLNNRENKERWYRFYGKKIPVILTPTGCHEEIPPPGKNPYADKKTILFLGSLCAGRMVTILNEMALKLKNTAEIHFIGKNKTGLYGDPKALRHDIVRHGELPEEETWDYIRYASAGLTLATGPWPFDNDSSKIVNYLRGGLPVISEEPIVNNHLIRETGYGKIFGHGNIDDFWVKAADLLDRPPIDKKEKVMAFMSREHSWNRRVETYLELFEKILQDPNFS